MVTDSDSSLSLSLSLSVWHWLQVLKNVAMHAGDFVESEVGCAAASSQARQLKTALTLVSTVLFCRAQWVKWT
jgi:hypothetical protein